MIKKFNEFLNEDSLDDFDIDGKIAKKRAEAPEQIKRKVNELIDDIMDKIQENCEVFFDKKGLKLEYSSRPSSDEYFIEYPDLGWGFTYSPRDSVSFLVVIGKYGRIEGVEKGKNYEFLREFAEFIKSKIKYLRCNDDIWEDSMSGIHGSASFIVRFSIQVKDLK